MPKVKWCVPKQKQKPYNKLAAVLRGYKLASGLNFEQIGEKLGVTANRAAHMIARPADEWTIGRLRRFCQAINCPLQEALEAAGK